MTLLAGRWAWWNHYGSQPITKCVERAVNAHLAGVIIKYGFPEQERLFTGAGVSLATERYVYPDQAAKEGQMLADAVDAGAVAAVINAEVEWESLGPESMEALIAAFRCRHPTVELYASVDTRGNRMALPFMRVLAAHVAGWLPEIYPKAFEQSTAASFAASLDGKDFGGIAVYPTIQTYDGIGPEVVTEQLAEVKRRSLQGSQAYTICHATDEEWAAFAKPEEVPMSDADKMELAIRRLYDNLISLILAGKLQDVANALAAVGVKAK